MALCAIGYKLRVLQIIGGVLLAVPKTIKLGVVFVILAFTLSTVLIFISGNAMFGLVSLLPIALTALIYRLLVNTNLRK